MLSRWKFCDAYPTNCSAVIRKVRLPNPSLLLTVLKVKNFHWALSPAGVLAAVQVRNTIAPVDVPVANKPIREYSRSWKAKEVIRPSVGSVCIRSSTAIG